MKTKEKSLKEIQLNDFISKDLVKVIDNENQLKIVGGMIWEGRRQSYNVIDTRTSSGYWLHFSFMH